MKRDNVKAQALLLPYGRRAGLVERCEEFALPDVYLERFEQDGDASEFAETYTGFFKAAFEPCLFVSLSDKRTPEDRQRVIESFSQRLQVALAQDPKSIRVAGLSLCDCAPVAQPDRATDF